MSRSTSKSPPLWALEKSLYRFGVNPLCGVDEVGRGPLAGPVVAAAVIFPPGIFVGGVRDSKKLSPNRRNLLYRAILRSSLAIGIASIGPDYIDNHNILEASLEAMRLAVKSLTITPRLVLVDGNRPIPNTDLPQRMIISGDQKCHAIASASIVAKVIRDLLMVGLHRVYPQYDFLNNKGYPTAAHAEALRRHGPCPIHRKSFKLHHTKLSEWS